MIVRKTTREEDQRVNELFAIAFEMEADDGPAGEEDPGAHHWAAFSDEGDMMSTFTISDFQMQFDGNCCKMGGIGGVATLPQYRRHGGIRGCFEKALPDMYRENYDFSYLYPFSTAYYRKFGYESCVQALDVSMLMGLMNPEKAGGHCCLAEKNHPMTEAIRAVDAVWEKDYNMMVMHSDDDYKWTLESDPASKLEFTYVYFDADNQPKGYTTFKLANQPDGRNLVCSRFFFVDRDGFNGLMQLLKTLAADHRFVKFTLPAKAGMEFMLPEWSMGAAQWSVHDSGMVRVINAESVLKKASYHGSGEVRLQIKDAQIAENNHCYHVVFEKGHAVSVEICRDESDSVMSISTFSALISGVTSFRNAAKWFRGLEVRKDNPCLSQVFHRKPLMIADYF